MGVLTESKNQYTFKTNTCDRVSLDKVNEMKYGSFKMGIDKNDYKTVNQNEFKDKSKHNGMVLNMKGSNNSHFILGDNTLDYKTVSYNEYCKKPIDNSSNQINK